MQRIGRVNPPRGTLSVPTPAWKTHSEATRGSLPVIPRVINARLWSSQKVPVAGPSKVRAGRQGHCLYQALAPSRQLTSS